MFVNRSNVELHDILFFFVEVLEYLWFFKDTWSSFMSLMCTF